MDARLASRDNGHDLEEETSLVFGSVSGITEQTPPISAPVLWLPDPEQWNFWREHYVQKEPEPDKPMVGFKGKAG